MRSREEFELVRQLASEGLNCSEISRRTGIPRLTVSGWLRAPPRRHLEKETKGEPPPLDAAAYSYLLGMYLGDGHVASFPRAWCLRIALDARYPQIVADCADAMRAVVPENSVGVIPHPTDNCVRVQAYSQRWPALLPQHGAGRKHERPIILTDWQLELTRTHPEQLIRGLIHSDGCRFVNRVRHGDKVYAYPRYMFSNRSRDIHAIFGDHLDLLGVAWRWSNDHTISIARRDAVARLDEFVGPKR
jgi:hypothetical protein